MSTSLFDIIYLSILFFQMIDIFFFNVIGFVGKQVKKG